MTGLDGALPWSKLGHPLIEKGAQSLMTAREERTREAFASAARKASEPDDEHDLQPLLGLRLRELRKERGYALAEVAKSTGISRSFLSLLENGQSEVTIGRLVRLMAFYEVHVEDFLSTLKPERSGLVRHADAVPIPSPEEQIDFFLLSLDRTKSFLPMLMTVHPGGGTITPGQHPGEEFIHIIEGELVLKLEGEDPLVMSEGDSVWFPGTQEHLVSNVSDRPARAIAVISPPHL